MFGVFPRDVDPVRINRIMTHDKSLRRPNVLLNALSPSTLSDPAVADVKLGNPCNEGDLPCQIRLPVRNFLALKYEVNNDEAACLLPETAEFWGRIQYLDGGDMMVGADTVTAEGKEQGRDRAYIKVRFCLIS